MARLSPGGSEFSLSNSSVGESRGRQAAEQEGGHIHGERASASALSRERWAVGAGALRAGGIVER